MGQRELAQKVGVGQNAVKAWVLGGNVSWHNCRAIADALGASRDYVRQLAGYIDPEDEPAPQSDPETRELVAIYGDLNERGREALFEVARALRQTQRRSGRNDRGRAGS